MPLGGNADGLFEALAQPDIEAIRRHVRLGPAGGLLEALAQPDGYADPDALLTEAAGASEPASAAVERLVGLAWLGLHQPSQVVNRRLLSSLAQRAGSIDGLSPDLHGALEYLDLWAAAVSYLDDHGLRGATWRYLAENPRHIEGLSDAIDRRGAQLGTRYGALMLRGMLTSLSDRDAASALFRKARRGSPGLAAAARIDDPAETYLSSVEVAAATSPVAARRAAFFDSFEVLTAPGPHAERATLLAFSCDPSFFRAFFPYWATTADYLSDVGMALHFVIVGDRAEVDACVERAHAVSRAVGRLRDPGSSGAGSGLSLSTAAVPDYVAQKPTLYACARYLLAREIARRMDSRVLVLDIDMQMGHEPEVVVDRLRRTPDGRVPLMIGRIPGALIPAWRVMAGVFWLPEGERGDRFMEDVESYTYLALSRPRSWTLDQNALAYAAEQLVAREGPDAIAEIGIGRRSFVQVAARAFFRNAQRERERRLRARSS